MYALCKKCGHFFISTIDRPQCGECGSRDVIQASSFDLLTKINKDIQNQDRKLTKLIKDNKNIKEIAEPPIKRLSRLEDDMDRDENIIRYIADTSEKTNRWIGIFGVVIIYYVLLFVFTN